MVLIFRRKLCYGSKKVEMVDSLDELKSSRSVIGEDVPNFEMLVKTVSTLSFFGIQVPHAGDHQPTLVPQDCEHQPGCAIHEGLLACLSSIPSRQIQ